MSMELDLDLTELGRSAEVTAEVMKLTEAAAEVVRATAPVDTGAYRDGIKTRLRSGRGRNVGRVELTDDKSILIEAKTGVAYRALKSVSGR